MKKQDLKNAYGSVPTEFHNSVVRTLNTLEEKPVKTARPHSRFFRVAIACALIAAIGTVGATAAAKLYPMNATRDGNYGITLDMQPTTDEGSESTAEMNLSLSADSNAPEYVKLNIGYLPEGVTQDQGKYSLNGEHSEKCLTLVLDRVGTKSTFSDTNIADFEQFEINGNVAVLADVVSSNEFDRRFYIYFEDMASFVTGYITNDYSEEEVKMIMENLTVTEGTAEENDGGPLSDAYSSGEEMKNGSLLDGLLEEQISYHYSPAKLGQGLECTTENDSSCVYTVDKIEVLDNIASLDENCFNLIGDVSLDEYADENGNLLSYERNSYKYGDGVTEPVRELVKTETINRRFVYATLTVTNNTDETDTFYLQYINMASLTQSGSELIGKDYGDEGEPEEPWYHEISYIDNNEVGEIGYKEGYLYKTIEPNSTETIHIGFWADEDQLDNYYITCQGESDTRLLGQTYNYSCIKVQ